MTTPMRLTAVQWMNIVNFNYRFDDYNKDEAVELTVKMTVDKLNEIYEGKLKETQNEI